MSSRPSLLDMAFGYMPAQIVHTAAEPRLADALADGSRTSTDLAAENRPGDFFASVPPGADAYLLKSVLHDWDDERAAAILRNCRVAMGPDARVPVVEQLMPEVVTERNRGTVMNDRDMLVSVGGRERTEDEFRELPGSAGLRVASISGPSPPSGYRVIKARPAG
ncbi:methyltransferase [Actinomadura sp. LOL_016]|uniref:methyltransferase n=1 Tax=unclassified Actinomadura TaxID=2626254 RepID=UPI003A7FF8C1